MRTLLNIILLLLITSLCFTSCKKDEREGCTDPTANNYNTLAEKDDGSCEYTDSSFVIWNNGTSGFWGDQYTGSFEVKSCYTDTTTILMNPDSTFTAADTTFIAADTTVTPPILADTIITPADTIVTGDTYLLAKSDSLGNFGLRIKLLNERDPTDFVDNGHLIFEAKLHPDANITNFSIFMAGGISDPGNNSCSSFLRSNLINFSTSPLDTNSFKEISIPLTDFYIGSVKGINLVFGVKGTNAKPNTPLVIFNNIRWTSKEEE